MEADGPGWSLIYPSKIPPEWDSYAPMENCFWIEFVLICLYPHQIIGVVKASSVSKATKISWNCTTICYIFGIIVCYLISLNANIPAQHIPQFYDHHKLSHKYKEILDQKIFLGTNLNKV